jgi:dihydroorotate dehydrogenase (fumarate)
VLFNRWLEPDIDLQELQANPSLVLSMRHELRVPLRWIAILRDQTSVSLAATSGVHFAEDVIKALLVGADVAMVASLVMRYGPDCIHKVLDEVIGWLTEREYESVSQLKGAMSRSKSPDPAAFERANYMKALVSFADKDVWRY